MNSLKKFALETELESDRRFYVFAYLSGNANKKLRQEIMQDFVGQKIPVAKCGIGNIIVEMEKYRKEQKNV